MQKENRTASSILPSEYGDKSAAWPELTTDQEIAILENSVKELVEDFKHVVSFEDWGGDKGEISYDPYEDFRMHADLIYLYLGSIEAFLTKTMESRKEYLVQSVWKGEDNA